MNQVKNFPITAFEVKINRQSEIQKANNPMR